MKYKSLNEKENICLLVNIEQNKRKRRRKKSKKKETSNKEKSYGNI
jgi:hypothetical protein